MYTHPRKQQDLDDVDRRLATLARLAYDSSRRLRNKAAALAERAA